jgi:hypothetical protein
MTLFLFGVVFTIILLPLMNAIADLLSSMIVSLTMKVNIGVMRSQKIIDELQEEEPEHQTNLIGFQSYTPEYYDEDDEDDE